MPSREPFLQEEDDSKLVEDVSMEDGFSKIIIVDNIPQVPSEKHEKLKALLEKIFRTFGEIKDVHYPQDENGVLKGYFFLEYTTAEAAETAVQKADRYNLDKKHQFRVSMYDDLKKYTETPDQFVPTTIEKPEPLDNLRSWLLDTRGIDQYAVLYEDITEILWNDISALEPPSEVRRIGWSQSYIQWSPLGSYLATLHQQGVALYGGPNWKRLKRFNHPNVDLIDFSPNEKYLITASTKMQDSDNPKDPQCIIVWDTRTAVKLRGFLGGGWPWPVFKWSPDDKYMARISEDTISVYETPSMNLLDKKSIKIEGVKEFKWSPSDNIIAYFVPELNNKPASVVLIEIPSRREIMQKTAFRVNNIKMEWHPSGDFLAVKMDRLTKTKKTAATNFELFRMREKDIPIELLEIKDNVVSFSWEPKGKKFAIIHGEGPRPDVSFYTMDPQVKLVKKLEKKAANHLFWSPQGGFIVLAGLGTLNGAFEFYNANDMESMGTDEHFMASVVAWDPTGRYVTSVVSGWRHQVENGYHIYSFHGKVLRKVLKDKFYDFLWRPRPPTLLSEEKLNNIKKNIKVYSRKFKKEDEDKMKAEMERSRLERQQMVDRFKNWQAMREEEYRAQADLRRELLGGEDSEDEGETEETEVWVEEIEETVQVLE